MEVARVCAERLDKPNRWNRKRKDLLSPCLKKYVLKTKITKKRFSSLTKWKGRKGSYVIGSDLVNDLISSSEDGFQIPFGHGMLEVIKERRDMETCTSSGSGRKR